MTDRRSGGNGVLGHDAIWMYWEETPGRTRPPYLDLCLETIHHHAGDAEVRVLDETTVFRWLPDMSDEVWFTLPSPVSRADYVRPRLVHRHGGLWVDSDTIAMSPLLSILGEIERNELVGWGRELGGRFYTNLFAGAPGGRFLKEWIREQDEVLRRTANWRTLGWAALGQDITWPLARRSSYLNMPISRIAPVPWWRWRELLSRLPSPGKVLADQPITVMLWNKEMGPELVGTTRDELLDGRMLLSRLLRIGLGYSLPEGEEDSWTRFRWVSELRFTTHGQRLEIRLRRLLERHRQRAQRDPQNRLHSASVT